MDYIIHHTIKSVTLTLLLSELEELQYDLKNSRSFGIKGTKTGNAISYIYMKMKQVDTPR